MKNPLLTIVIIFLAITSGMNFVSAQNETEMNLVKNEEEKEIVQSNEDGHFNISFDDGYNGYCINYGQEEAKTNDSFKVEDTSHAVNNQNGENIGNYLKVYFFDYYEEAMKDEIVTQHTIWHFTDNFNGWRLDYDLIENIKKTSSEKTIPDHGAVKKINDTAEAVFDFEVLKSGTLGNQNFFGYKITYRDIINEIMNNTSNETLTNSTEKPVANKNSTPTNNITFPNIEENRTSTNTNEDIREDNKSHIEMRQERNESQQNSDSAIHADLSKNVTGNAENIGIIMMLILFGILIIKYFRD